MKNILYFPVKTPACLTNFLYSRKDANQAIKLCPVILWAGY